MPISPNCAFCGPRLNQSQPTPAHFVKNSERSLDNPHANHVIEFISIPTRCPFGFKRLLGNKWKACKHQQGFTALELIVVLIVGMAIIALAASKMDLLFSKANVFEEISNLNILHANLKSLKTSSGYGDADTDLVPQLISTKGIPQNMSMVNKEPRNLWGGPVHIKSTVAGFSIRYKNVPAEACVQLATQSNRGGAFATVKVNSAATVTGEYSAAKASADCSSGVSNTLVWMTNS